MVTLLRIILWPLQLFIKHIDGIENLPDGPFILASNHASYIDAPLLMHICAKRGKHVRFFATNDPKWKTPFWNWWFKLAGAIRVNGSLDKGLAALKNKDAIGLFPEAERTPSGKIHSTHHKGLGVLALKSHAPIVPIRINTYWWWNRFRKAPTFKRTLHVTIGKPMHYKGRYSDKRAHAIVTKTLSQIRRLT